MPSMSVEEIPDGYGELLARVKADVLATRFRAVRAANAELLGLYWRIGRLIADRQEAQGWGARVIERLAADLRRELPQVRGWSRSNLAAMRTFALTWPEEAIVQQPVGRLPWGHVMLLLNSVDAGDRDWYADRAATGGWSRKMLEHHVATGLRTRLGAAPSNFATHLDRPDADLAEELVKDPYVFDFLGFTDQVSERQVEDRIMERLRDTLLELGSGFAFVGRQVRFQVDDDEYSVDLLLFHVEQVRYVVVELKVGKFRPEHAGQLGFYVQIVDDQLRRPDRHAPTVGILLCTSRGDQTVRYALRSQNAPMAVSTYTFDTLPVAERAALPAAAAAIAAALVVVDAAAGDEPPSALREPESQ
jgi:predicted nuclease of restriction endonuclease-like (RecB) superfamily